MASNGNWTNTDWNAALQFIDRCLTETPMKTPQSDVFTYWSYKYCIMEYTRLRQRLVDMIRDGIQRTTATVNVLWCFLCSTALSKTSSERKTISADINAAVRNLMHEKRGDFNSQEKEFIKFGLAFCYPTRYGELFDDLQATAGEVCSELEKPLLRIYDDLTASQSRLLTIHKDLDSSYFNATVERQQDLMPSAMLTDLFQWYEHERISDEKAMRAKDFYQKWGFDWAPTQKLRMKDGIYHAGRLTLNMFKTMAYELQDSYQSLMANIGVENRTNMGRPARSQHREVGARAPPPKTISRAQHKSFREYTNKPDPREGYILDFLRCALVVEDDEEAVSLFHLIAEKFKGRIVRVKNGFDPEAECNYGYRAVMMNLMYEHPDPILRDKGRRMITEVQIILRDFLRVRKKMHLYYKVVRAKEQWAIGRDFSKMWDL